MKNTQIICCYSGCGRDYYLKYREDDKIVLNLNIADFYFEKRKRTKEELEQMRKEWDRTPHLLSSEGFINQIKDEVVSKENPKFPQNMIEYIKEKMGQVDIILLGMNKDVVSALKAENIDYILVFPESGLLETYVGRTFIKTHSAILAKTVESCWEDDMIWLEMQCLSSHQRYFRLGYGEYLSKIINKI